MPHTDEQNKWSEAKFRSEAKRRLINRLIIIVLALVVGVIIFNTLISNYVR